MSAQGDADQPHSLEAEMAVLGAVMVDATLLTPIAEVVEPKHFYADQHQQIFAAMKSLSERGAPHFDKVAIIEELQSRRVAAFGNRGEAIAYLNRLLDGVHTVASAMYFARVVRDRAAQRAMLVMLTQGQQLVHRNGDEVGATAEQLERMFRGFREKYDGTGIRAFTLAELRAAARRRAEDAATVIQETPWPTLNAHIGGFGPALHGWSAAGKHGKTHAAYLNALYDAYTHGYSMYWAVEGGRDKAYAAIVEMVSGVRVQMLGGHARLSERDRATVRGAEEFLDARFPRLLFYGGGDEGITVATIVAEARRWAAKAADEGTRLASVWIDVAADLADVRGEAGNARDRERTHERKRAAFRKLRDAAIKIGVPIHVVDHQNTEVGDGRPSRNNIREGGDLHLIAENLILLWRHERVKSPEDGLFIVDASRHGREGSFNMRYVRGIWLDQGTRPPQTRAFFEPWLDEALGRTAPEQTQLSDVADLNTRRRTRTIEVDGQPAHVVSPYASGEPAISDDEVERLAYPSSQIDDRDLDALRDMFGSAN